MDTLSHVVNLAEAMRCKEEYMVLKTSTANVLADATLCDGNGVNSPSLALHHRLLCTVVKHANQLRILNRQGRYADVHLTRESCVRYIASSEACAFARSVLFYAVCPRTLALITPSILASGEVVVGVREVAVCADDSHGGNAGEGTNKEVLLCKSSNNGTNTSTSLVAAVAGEAERVYVLGQQHVYEVNEATASVNGRFALSPRTVAQADCFDFHAREQLLLVPSKPTCLDLISTHTRTSVLATAWEPHGGSAPSFARFLQSREQAAIGVAASDVCLFTATRGNTELRYWTFSVATRRFTLRQEVILTPPPSPPPLTQQQQQQQQLQMVCNKRGDGDDHTVDDNDNNNDNNNIIGSRSRSDDDGVLARGHAMDTPTGYVACVTPGDEYVVLCARDSCHTLVIKNNRTLLRAEHVTVWRTPAPALACAAYVGKFADSLLSQSALLELCVVLRTADGVFKCVLGSDRHLAGAARNALIPSTSDSVATWFDQVPPASSPRAPLAVAGSLAATTATTTTTRASSMAAIMAAAAAAAAALPLSLQQQQQQQQAQSLTQQSLYMHTSANTPKPNSVGGGMGVPLSHGMGAASSDGGCSGQAPVHTSTASAVHSASLPPPSAVATAATTTNVAPLTAVSSSLRGDSRSTHAISEASAAGLVRQQACKFCDQVRVLDAELALVQKTASNTMCMLQSSALRDKARTIGHEFALRNKSRLSLKDAAASAASAAAVSMAATTTATEAGVMNESQRKLILAISSVMKEVEGSTANASAAALKTLLQRQLKQSVERAVKEAEVLDVPGSSLGNITSTDAAAQFRQALTAATSRVLTAIKERHDGLQEMLELSEKQTSALLGEVDDICARVCTAVQAAKADVNSATTALAQLQSTRVQVPIDPDVLTARAVALAERDDWAGAFTLALEASDISVLLGFLESKVCQEKHAIAKSPTTLTLPLFLSLCLQLTFELGAHVAAVPLRVQILHDLYLEWDDTLKDMKSQSGKSSAHVTSFDTVKRELANVAAALLDVDVQLLDRRTRSKYRLVTKLIDTLLQNT